MTKNLQAAIFGIILLAFTVFVILVDYNQVQATNTIRQVVVEDFTSLNEAKYFIRSKTQEGYKVITITAHAGDMGTMSSDASNRLLIVMEK